MEMVDEVNLSFEEFSKWDGIEGEEALCFIIVHCIGVVIYFGVMMTLILPLELTSIYTQVCFTESIENEYIIREPDWLHEKSQNHILG